MVSHLHWIYNLIRNSTNLSNKLLILSIFSQKSLDFTWWRGVGRAALIEDETGQSLKDEKYFRFNFHGNFNLREFIKFVHYRQDCRRYSRKTRPMCNQLLEEIFHHIRKIQVKVKIKKSDICFMFLCIGMRALFVWTLEDSRYEVNIHFFHHLSET